MYAGHSVELFYFSQVEGAQIGVAFRTTTQQSVGFTSGSGGSRVSICFDLSTYYEAVAPTFVYAATLFVNGSQIGRQFPHDNITTCNLDGWVRQAPHVFALIYALTTPPGHLRSLRYYASHFPLVEEAKSAVALCKTT
jgi:hypothetical protein